MTFRMTNPPLVSIVIATYNGERHLEATVEAALAQDCSFPYECIVVDNGSTDRTFDLLARFGTRIRVLTEATRGAAAARNRGISASRGQYVCLNDHDDVPTSDRLTKQVLELQRDPHAVLCHGNAWRVNEELCPDPERPVFHSNVEEFPLFQGEVVRRLFEANFVVCPTVMAPRSVLMRCGAFDPRFLQYGEDYHLWLRLARLGTFRFISEPICAYRYHEGQASRARERMAEGCLRARESFLAANPDVRFRLGARWTNFVLAQRAFEYGYELNSLGDPNAARRFYARSFRARPSLRTALAFAKTTVPKRVVKRLRMLQGTSNSARL